MTGFNSKRQMALAKLDDDDDTQVYEDSDTLLIVYQRGFADGKAAAQPEQQVEPICPECKAAVLYECVACSSNNYPATAKRQWDTPSASFNDWWNGDYDDSANPFEKDSAAYWAWAGWKAAQRPWVGLTDEEKKTLQQQRDALRMMTDILSRKFLDLLKPN
jgi:hypothetical protein